MGPSFRRASLLQEPEPVALWFFFMIFPLHASDLWLKVGEVRALAAPLGATVKVGARGVIRVLDGDRDIRLIGLKPGLTTLIVGGTPHNVRVTHGEQQEFVREARRAVSRMLGLRIELKDSRTEITGTLLRLADWLTLAEIARRHDGEYVFRAHAIAEAADESLGHLRRLARERGFPIVRFSASPEFIAELPRAEPTLRAEAGRQLKPYGIAIVGGDSQLTVQPLIKTRVILAEVARNFSRDLGVRWPGEVQTPLGPPNALTGDGGEPDVVATLRALESKGQAQILASPDLLCRSGGEARFHAGGEFPVRTRSRHGDSVTWKPHGVLLRVKPRADFQGAISLEIETEISLLDVANSVDGIPALKTNSVRSHFDLPGKRTVALSGLLREEYGRSREGIPLLSQIPVLGPLFSSQNFRQNRSELVVFVTPEIHSADGDDAIRMPEGWVDERD